jgi:hypothetical protein
MNGTNGESNVAVADPDRPQQQATAKASAPQVGPGCKPLRRVAFEDNFKSADPGWGIAGNTPASFVDGELVIKPGANKSWNQLYPSLFSGMRRSALASNSANSRHKTAAPWASSPPPSRPRRTNGASWILRSWKTIEVGGGREECCRRYSSLHLLKAAEWSIRWCRGFRGRGAPAVRP